MRTAAPLVALICVLSAGGALADDRHDDHARREAQGHHGGPPPGRNDRIAREAQRQTGGGRVLSVQPAEGGHKVKVLKDGEVHVLTVPEREQDRE